MFRTILIYCIVILLSIKGVAQQPPAVIDSLMRQLASTKGPAARIELLGRLSMVYMSVDPQTSDSVGKKMLEEAEVTRDRTLIIKALLVNGDRNSYFASRKENLDKSVEYFNKALVVAKDNNLDLQTGEALLALSSAYRLAPDADKAFECCSQAISYIASSKNDSLAVLAELEYGEVYSLKRQKLLALKHLLTGLRAAEELKQKDLLRDAYLSLCGFYAGAEVYDKAIDYAVNAMKILDEKKGREKSLYQKVVDLNRIATLYSAGKNYDMATYYFNQSIDLADSLHYEPLKVPAYQGIVNNYLLAGKPQQALDYFSKEGSVRQFAQKFGMSAVIDYAYGYIYTDLGKFDSASYYYQKAAPFFESNSNPASSFTYYYQLGRMNYRRGDYKNAETAFLQAKDIAARVADPKRTLEVAKQLDSVYLATGDFRQSRFYFSLFQQFKDSLDKLGKEKDILDEETKDEQKRHERVLKEREENERRKNNIQYMAITFGIVLLFIFLVVLGMFKVSAGVIKAIGFFAFLMFFEFIFLVFKKNIHSVTEGEPWKDLLFMIALAALLVPLHHWLEHKVLHYLTSHNRLTSAGHRIRKKLFRRSGSDSD